MEYVTIEGEYPAGPHGGVALVCALPVWLMLRALEAGRKSPTEVMRDVELLIRKVAEVLMECGVFKDAKATCDLATNPPSTLDAGSIGFVVRVLHRPGLSYFGGSFIASLTEDSRGLVLEYASYQTPIAQIGETDRRAP